MRLQAINNFLVWAAIIAIWLVLLLSVSAKEPGVFGVKESMELKVLAPELGSFGAGQPGHSFALNEFWGTDPRKSAADAPALFLRQALEPSNLAVQPGFGGRSAR